VGFRLGPDPASNEKLKGRSRTLDEISEDYEDEKKKNQGKPQRGHLLLYTWKEKNPTRKLGGFS